MSLNWEKAKLKYVKRSADEYNISWAVHDLKAQDELKKLYGQRINKIFFNAGVKLALHSDESNKIFEKIKELVSEYTLKGFDEKELWKIVANGVRSTQRKSSMKR